MDDKRLFLLDAYALIYRAYYALIRSPRVTSKGFNTSAIFGFCNTLDEILRKENPTHIAVCFDPKGGHTFRHEAYPEYKAQRDAQPEDITLSIPFIKDIIAAYNIPAIEIERYEADDIIGTLARQAEKEGFMTYMMTPDKDYGQLVTDRVVMYRPSLRGQGFEIRGVKEVCERYGISSPLQVIDLLALEGDASDNIPGCPGVGEKTASKLIAEWGSVENLLDHTDSLRGALKQKVADNAEQIRFSKFLATIKTDVPLTIDLETLRRKPEDVTRLKEIYTQLEFKTFIQRLGATRQAAVAPATAPPAAADGMGSLFDIPDQPEPQLPLPSSGLVKTTVMTDPAAVADVVTDACRHRHVGISMTTTGTDAMTARWTGIAVALSPDNSVYIKLPDEGQPRAELLDIMQPLFTSGTTTIVSHDVKRDYIVLKNAGIIMSAHYYDTSVAHYLLQPEMRHRLADIALTYLNYTAMDYADDIRTSRRGQDAMSTDETAARAGEHAALVLRLSDVLARQLADAGLDRLMTDIELPFIKVLAEMEWTGVRIDVNELAALSDQLTSRMHEMEQKVYELAGTTFNISSPMQVGDVLFDRLKIDPSAKRTKRGAYSTTEEILEKYRSAHPVVDLILKIRGLRKLLATYINALPELINPATGKIHTTYNQTVTATGRISSTNPNLQNIPVRTDDGREIRRAFIADPGDLFLSADYSQIELRLMADLSGDPDMIEAFREGADIHRATAAKIYKESIDDVTDNQRRNAKTANFGIIYGISAFGLSERLGIPRSEAKMLIDGYFESYPHIREYIAAAIEQARANGYVTTIMGRKRLLPDINSRNAVVRSYAERNAVNAPLQGSAADIIKKAMIDIYNAIGQEGLRSRMIMQVHDELIFNVVPDELPRLQEIVTRCMTGAYNGRVPLEVSAGVGQNWLQAH